MFKQALGAAYRSARRVRGLARAIRKRRPFRPGLPPGLTFAEVDAVCWAKTGRGLRSAVFAHLSGWKESGAYRLVLRLDDRREWPVVYKLSVYGGGQIPALQGFPARVGPPEYAVYRFGSGPVSDYLPEVYFAEEQEPGRCYRYLMEDLYDAYQV
ncbi:MAG TPA: hypothetical protein VFF68_12405, partial [Anaerolineaceae bacterium]|nr:hypothetical protein [Anaerolineaceae bacterium]